MNDEASKSKAEEYVAAQCRRKAEVAPVVSLHPIITAAC